MSEEIFNDDSVWKTFHDILEDEIIVKGVEKSWREIGTFLKNRKHGKSINWERYIIHLRNRLKKLNFQTAEMKR